MVSLLLLRVSGKYFLLVSSAFYVPIIPQITENVQFVLFPEMTNVIATNTEATVPASDYPEEPLLQQNEMTMNSYQPMNKENCSQNANTQTFHGDSILEGISLQKLQPIAEKATKPFYHKLPSIPKTMSSLAASEPRVSD